jgi:hypothetical protein
MARAPRRLYGFLSAFGGSQLVWGVFYLAAPYPVHHHPAMAVGMLVIGSMFAAVGLSLQYSARR